MTEFLTREQLKLRKEEGKSVLTEFGEECIVSFKKSSTKSRFIQKKLTKIDPQIFYEICTTFNNLSHFAILKITAFYIPPPQLKSTKKCFLFTEYKHYKLSDILDDSTLNASLTPTNRYIILFGIASALSYLHYFNIFHGSICPKNIYISHEGGYYRPFLTNFAFLKDQSHREYSNFETDFKGFVDLISLLLDDIPPELLQLKGLQIGINNTLPTFIDIVNLFLLSESKTIFEPLFLEKDKIFFYHYVKESGYQYNHPFLQNLKSSKSIKSSNLASSRIESSKSNKSNNLSCSNIIENTSKLGRSLNLQHKINLEENDTIDQEENEETGENEENETKKLIDFYYDDMVNNLSYQAAFNYYKLIKKNSELFDNNKFKEVANAEYKYYSTHPNVTPRFLETFDFSICSIYGRILNEQNKKNAIRFLSKAIKMNDLSASITMSTIYENIDKEKSNKYHEMYLNYQSQKQMFKNKVKNI